MMDVTRYIYKKHQDAAHGWLEVKQHDIKRAGLTMANFSKYSYISNTGNTLYLEEDQDALKFIRACDAAGICYRVEVVRDADYSDIRNLHHL